MFHDPLSQSYVYHNVWSGITGRISLQTAVTDNWDKHVCVLHPRAFAPSAVH